MKASAYPRSTVEAKWRRAWNELSLSSSSAPQGGGAPEPNPRYLLPWPGSRDGAADGGFLRRLVLGDLSARFQRHAGRSIYLAHGVEAPVPDTDAKSDGSTSPLAALDDVKSRLAITDARDDALATSDPDCVRLVQWLFLRFLEAKLILPGSRRSRASEARRATPGDEGAADWWVDILPYAERLFSDVDKSSWSPEARKQQKAVIGRRRGVEVLFPVSRPFEAEFEQAPVFTTQVEAICGAMFLLIAPEHELLDRVTDGHYQDEVAEYVDRLARGEEPRLSGMRTGGFALNPVNLERIPIIVSPLARSPFSGGLVLGVPGHDLVAFELARRLSLPVREVIHSREARFDFRGRLVEPWLGEGILTNSGPFNGLGQRSAREKIVSALSRRGMARKTTRYALTKLLLATAAGDGPPVPLLRCERCGVVPVPDARLPFVPEPSGKDDGESGPRRDRERCPACSGDAKPEPGRILSWVGEALLLFQVPSGPVPPFPEPARSSPEEDGAKDVEETSESRPVAEVGPRRAGDDAGDDASETGDGELDDEGELPAIDDGSALDEELIEGRGESSILSKEKALHADEVEETDEAFDPEPTGDEVHGSSSELRAAADASGEISTLDDHAGDDEDRAEMREGGNAESFDELDDGNVGDEWELDDEGSLRHPRATDEGDSQVDGAGSEEARAGRKRDRRRRPTRRAPELDEEPEDDEPIDGDDPDERARRRIDPSAFESLRGPEGERFAPFRSERLKPLFPADVVLAPGALRTRAIIATRFVTKFLYDLRLVPSFEPFRRFFRVGDLVVSKGSPRDGSGASAHASSMDLIEKFGGDAFRMAAIGLGPPESRAGLGFCELNARARCLDRIFRLVTRRLEKGRFVSRRVLVAKHVLIHKVTDRLRRMRFHVALSAIDEFVRFLRCDATEEEVDRSALETFTIVLSPFAPYLAQELWSMLGHKDSVADAKWPEPSTELLASAEREIPVWVDGRVRDRMPRPADEPAEELEADALARDAVRRFLGGRAVERVIAVPGRFVSIIGRAENASIETTEQS